jgi:Right handed beta helix region
MKVDWSNISGVRLLAYPGERPVLDGGYASGHFAVLRDNVSDVIISGLTITHYDDSYGNGAIIGTGNASNVVIENNVFDANGQDAVEDHHIYLGGGSAAGRLSGWTIRNNWFINPAAGAIHSFGTNSAVNVVIEGNRFIGGRWAVLISDEGSSNWDIRNNTIVGSRDSAIAFGYYTRGVRSNVTNIRVARNVISVAPGAFPLRVDSVHVSSGALVDLGNVYWAGGSAIVMWAYSPNGSSKTLDLAGYRAASGQGNQSVEANPGLSSSLTLPSGSPFAGWGAP